jgi:GNAT superfamily N-acetyltransferase
MKIAEVTTEKDARAFLLVPTVIYANDTNWVRPLDDDINAIFDPSRNDYFNHGLCKRWLLFDNNNKYIGRVAAFINHKKATSYEQATGGMGFFECINDAVAAKILLSTCQHWLANQGMEAMDGPINFGENDRYWGLLVHGFMEPGFGMAYNPPYYQSFFEDFGFYKYYEQVSNHLDITKPLPERFNKIAEWVMNKPGYTFDHLHKKNFEKYAADFVNVYNEAWGFHENFSPMVPGDVEKTFKQMSAFIEERFIWFAYHDGVCIGFLIMVPDINVIIKKMKGNSGIIGKLIYTYYLLRKSIWRARIIIMGVTPKFQKSGIESAIIKKASDEIYSNKQYKEVELSWVGDFNPKMRALHENIGATLGKTHHTYRKLFDPSKEEKRSIIIARDTKNQLLKKD